jgi:NADH:ubiquinone oxidoreductase subunit E
MAHPRHYLEDPEVDFFALDSMITERFGNDRENLMMILQAIQEQYHYLPKAALMYLSEKIAVPISDIYSVASFYKVYSLIPKGKFMINVCLGTACHVRGADKIMRSLEEVLGIGPGGTTADLLFSLESVRCLGCCALGPVMTINGKAYGGLDRASAIKVLEDYRNVPREGENPVLKGNR